MGFWTKLWEAKQDVWDKFHSDNSKVENPKSSRDADKPLLARAIPKLLICAR